MARVVRIDTREWIGYFVELYGPLEPGAQGWDFRCVALSRRPPAA
jgi:hypothetical protein